MLYDIVPVESGIDTSYSVSVLAKMSSTAYSVLEERSKTLLAQLASLEDDEKKLTAWVEARKSAVQKIQEVCALTAAEHDTAHRSPAVQSVRPLANWHVLEKDRRFLENHDKRVHRRAMSEYSSLTVDNLAH